MPVVPITTAQRATKSGPTKLSDIRTPPPEPFALMAAAQMHAEGRLIDPESPADERTRQAPFSRRPVR